MSQKPFNLEAQPDLITEVTDPNNVERYLINKNKQMKKWFKGFKKQELKRLQDVEKKLNVSADVLPFKSYERGYLVGYVKAKKEILGK